MGGKSGKSGKAGASGGSGGNGGKGDKGYDMDDHRRGRMESGGVVAIMKENGKFSGKITRKLVTLGSDDQL